MKTYSDVQNAQARFIVERLRRAIPLLSGALKPGTAKARESLTSLERAMAAYDDLSSRGEAP